MASNQTADCVGALDSAAASMTNYIPGSSGLIVQGGQLGRAETVLEVRWRWIILPTLADCCLSNIALDCALEQLL